jgi:hypothetical protein
MQANRLVNIYSREVLDLKARSLAETRKCPKKAFSLKAKRNPHNAGLIFGGNA